MRDRMNRLPVLPMLVFVAVTMLLMACSGSKYDKWDRWRTPAAEGDDPFGHDIFDGIMSEAMPKGYHVAEEPFNMVKPSEWSDKAILVTADKVDSETACRIDTLVDQGCKVLLVTDDFVRFDTEFGWGVWFSGYYTAKEFDFYTFKRQIKEGLKSSFTWCADSTVYDAYESLVTGVMKTTGDVEVLAQLGGMDALVLNESLEENELLEVNNEYMEEEENKASDGALVAKVKSNRRGGAFYIVSTPLLMTNYGILDSNLSSYVSRVMALIADRPVTRMRVVYQHKAGENASDNESSSLKYFLSQPALRAALYIVLALLLLLTFFRARRRQRVIPVYKEPANHSLEFVQIVGNIYCSRGDYQNLLSMKYLYFAEELRRRLMIDINDRDADPQNVYLLVNKTGLDAEFIQKTVNDARIQILSEDEEALDIIDRMNKILKAL